MTFVSRDPVGRLKEMERGLLGLLRDQFGMLELEVLYDTYGEKTCMDFLNEAVAFYQKKQERRPKNFWGLPDIFRDAFDIPTETVEEFRILACEEPVKPCREPLTICKFLKMCRVAYDAAGVTSNYHPNASDIFIYCHERDVSFAEDFREFEDRDWDSPEVFRSFYSILRYHPEELQYGGMRIRLRETAHGWTADFSVGNPLQKKQAILAYIALRRSGYPIEYIRPEELLNEVRALE